MNNFDKKFFSNTLKKIYNQYPNQNNFARSANVNRTYISKYINEKLEEPPSPKILRRLAKASKELITYQELMKMCGYLNEDETIIVVYQDRLEQIINLIDGLTVDEFNTLRKRIKSAKIKINKQDV